jgi:prepilin-type N-terminal cleavage/methylation domain-containing protein
MERDRRHNTRGFTLIELMIVILLMGMIVGTAAPRLLPLLMLTEHESEARRLVGYGRSAMAHASMTHTPIRVRIDLDQQKYWTEALPSLIPESESAASGSKGSAYGGYDEDEDDWVPDDDIELARASSQILKGDEVDQEYTSEDEQNKVLDKQRGQMQDQFRAMADNSLFARALRVKHDDDGYVEDRSLFNRNDDGYEDDDEEEMRQPVSDPLLAPHVVIDSVWIDSVMIGDEEFKKGIVDIELSPLGLDTEVSLALFNEDEDLLIVHWDPMTANAWYTRELGLTP